uniref:Uncharacterized protein n=1 Tax=Aegilops tauschii subsp. strangulata TaxID=200361 RepID=A0A453SJ28_AEGTS
AFLQIAWHLFDFSAVFIQKLPPSDLDRVTCGAFVGGVPGDHSPGFYETRVAYYSWRGAPGYTFASIPDY